VRKISVYANRNELQGSPQFKLAYQLYLLVAVDLAINTNQPIVQALCLSLSQCFSTLA
jgi:hypothetical protein